MKVSGAINFDPKAGRVVRASITGNGVFSLAPPGVVKPRPNKKGTPPKAAQYPTFRLKVEVVSILMR